MSTIPYHDGHQSLLALLITNTESNLWQFPCVFVLSSSFFMPNTESSFFANAMHFFLIELWQQQEERKWVEMIGLRMCLKSLRPELLLCGNLLKISRPEGFSPSLEDPLQLLCTIAHTTIAHWNPKSTILFVVEVLWKNQLGPFETIHLKSQNYEL